ncbi:hypothetical protein RJT34_02838 [Clitoria ternatea]|uniref:TAFII-230 TBP-binding domain-containing protein n=1 Tax=Clitoria ternatea TaxID=43366 RepID=A0AAN9PZ92_CLITE
MSLLSRFFYKRPPDGLLEFHDRVYGSCFCFFSFLVFNSCFSTEALPDGMYELYFGGVLFCSLLTSMFDEFDLIDDEEEYEESGEGNHFLGFMFGNVDNSGDLDVDYLDEDAKEHLSALADKLGPSLIDIDLSGKSPQTPHDVVEQGEVVCQEKLYHAVFDILLVSFFPLKTESTSPVFYFFGIISHLTYAWWKISHERVANVLSL